MADSATSIIENTLKKKAVEEHELVYDSSAEPLEPVYFWVLDMMNGMFGGKVEKLTDNFSSAPGSTYAHNFNVQKIEMQRRVGEVMGTINTVIKSIINIIYDLKDFEIRLKHYESAKSKNKEEAHAGLLALKQIWMDNVDIKKGQGSINALASGNLMFATLRDAFMVANNLEDVKNLDLNDRVKRMLEARIAEFLTWKDLSEQELKKRYNIEVNYLKSQVNSIQLYSRWAKPYLKSSAALEMEESDKNPALVKAFSNIWLELSLMGRNKMNFEDAQLSYQIPKKVKKPKRDYFSVVIVDFKFRGYSSQRSGGAFVGRATMSFKGYSLNDEELKFFDQEMKKSDLNDVLKLIEGATTESLDELKKDIDYYLKKEPDKKKEEEKKKSEDNPFSALFSFIDWKKNKDKKKDDKKEINAKDIKEDSYIETYLRNLAVLDAKTLCFSIYDVYKKAHGMPSHDNPYD